MTHHSPSNWRAGDVQRRAGSYLVALAPIAAALLARWLLYPLLEERRPYLTLFGGVALAVWLTRWKEAALAALVGFFAAYFWLVAPQQGPGLQVDFAAEFAGYVLSAGFIIFFGEAMHRARERAERETAVCAAAEQAERRQKELLRVTLASIGDGVVVTDSTGSVISLNAEAERLTGWNLADALGQPLADVFHIVNEETRLPVENPVEKVLRLGAVVGLANHTALIAQDGTSTPIDDSAAPIRDASGKVLGVVLVFRDVAQQRAAQQAHARLAAIVEFSGDAIITKDLDGVVQTWNAGAEALFGYRAEEIIGQPISLLVPPDRWQEEVEILTRLGHGESSSRFETVRVARDGRRIPVVVSVSPLCNSEGRVIGASTILHDISALAASRDALAEERERLATTLASIGDGVITTDADARVTYLNAVAESVTGWSQQDAVGQPLESVFRIVNEETRRSVESPAIRALREGVIMGLANHTLLIRKDGAERPIDDSAAPIKGSRGRILGCVLVFRDITERRRVEQSLTEDATRIASVLDHVIDGIITIDGQGVIESFNPAAEKLFGYRASEVIGQNVKLLMPEPFHSEHDGYLASYLRTGVARIIGIGREVVGRRRDHSTFPMDLAVSEFSVGQRRYFTGIVRDISERKRTEIQVYDLLAELKSADRRKDEFLAILAHELRGPLAPLSHMLEIMKQSEGDGELIRQARDTMERQLRQLVRLVDDLLDMSRISSDKLELRMETVELGVIIRQAVETCRPLANDAHHELNVEPSHVPIYMHGDAARLAQVFANLLNNACKYTPPGGRISLAVERQGSDVLVTVQDTGVGIPANMLPHVFDMFTQVDPASDRWQLGLGIGLALVKRLVEMHGGSVVATSAGPGQGSEFSVRLPIVVDRPQGAAWIEPARVARATGLRILVVDDNRDSATSLALLLQLGGHETATGYDGVEAVETAERFAPDLVLLDLGLPRLSGYEAARMIRQQPWGRRMMLVALTGWGQDDDRRKSNEAGFDHHLVKPVDQNSLAILLEDARRRREPPEPSGSTESGDAAVEG